MVKNFIKNTPNTVILLIVLIAVGLLSLAIPAFIHGYYVINPDGISYISIAQHYAGGHLNDALNAYWSPMLSWLMVPYILLGAEPIVAYMINNLLACIAIIGILGYLIHKHITKDKLIIASSCLAVAIFFISRAFNVVTPDVLVVLWIMVYALVLTELANRKLSVVSASVIGAVGTIGYFVKLYLLPVFIVATVAYLFFKYYEKNNLGKALKSALMMGSVIVVAFSIVAAGWVTALSVKYDKFMIGSAFGFTMTSNRPGDEGLKVLSNPVALSSERALSAWEDPTFIDRGGEFKSSAKDYKHMIKHRFDVMPTYISTINHMSPIILLTPVFIALFYVHRRRDDMDGWRAIGVATIVLTVYMGGYTLIGQSDNERYLWPLLFMAIIIYTAFVARLLETASKKKSGHVALKVLILAILPLLILLQSNVKVRDVVQNDSRGYYYYNSSQEITESGVDIKKPFVANTFASSQYFAHYLNEKTLGVAGFGSDDTCKVMNENDVRYYLYTYKKNKEIETPDCLEVVETVGDGSERTLVLRVKGM